MDQKDCIRKNISRLEKVQMGYKAEELTAKLEGGITTAHTFTMDVIVAAEKRAIEVKAQHILAKKYACRMEKDALADKIAYGKKMGYKLETRLIIVDDSTTDHIMAVYKKAGVGNFDVQSMEFVGSYNKYGKKLGIKFDAYGKRIGNIVEKPFVTIDWSDKEGARVWQWTDIRGQTKIEPIKVIVEEEPLAVSSDKGYTKWIASAVDEQNDADAMQRAGTMFIRKDSTGEVVQAGYWMDYPEDFSMKEMVRYSKLSRGKRAAGELMNQKKYGFKEDFEFHKSQRRLIKRRLIK
jgi:hypothetical protein